MFSFKCTAAILSTMPISRAVSSCKTLDDFSPLICFVLLWMDEFLMVCVWVLTIVYTHRCVSSLGSSYSGNDTIICVTLLRKFMVIRPSHSFYDYYTLQVFRQYFCENQASSPWLLLSIVWTRTTRYRSWELLSIVWSMRSFCAIKLIYFVSSASNTVISWSTSL